MEDSGFIDYNKLQPSDLKTFRARAKDLGFTVEIGRVRDRRAYNYNQPTGYYLKKNNRFYNPYAKIKDISLMIPHLMHKL